MSKAVLIHGCHLQADLGGKEWKDIVWGLDPEGMPTLYGRATMGIGVALNDTDVEMIIFSTGASERDGVKEGEYTYNWAITHAHQLGQVLNRVPSRLERHLKEISVLDIQSQNTSQECRTNFALCMDEGIDEVILVSSPWHVQRCLSEALNVAEEFRLEGKTPPKISCVASYGSTEGALVLEPPHRGDYPKTKFHILCRRLFKIAVDRLEAFYLDFDELLKKYGA